MTAGEQDLPDHPSDLITTEGVDEGSAASTAEGGSSGSDDTAGAAPHGGPAGPEATAAPLDVETEDMAHDRDQAPGQQLAEGEG